MLALIAALIGGCPSTGLHGLTPAWQQTQGVTGTRQACLPEPDVLEAADAAMVALLREAVRQGVIKDYHEAAARVGTPALCIVAGPEMCGAVLGAGCTHQHGIWMMRDRWRALLHYELCNWLFLRLGPTREAWKPVEAAVK